MFSGGGDSEKLCPESKKTNRVGLINSLIKFRIMKKIILSALVAIVSLTANAQFWAGGQVGFNTSKTSIDGNELDKANTFTLIPEIGYNLNDNWDIAVAIGYAHQSGKGMSSVNG